MSDSQNLSDPELRRYAGQISLQEIGLSGQEKLKNIRVAVVGAGGLGTVVLQYLAAIGIGHIGIIDYSLVDELNIQRQVLYGGNDLGKLKTIISKQQLQNLFPLISFEIINIQLTSGNMERILAPFQLIVDATNNETSHTLLCEACEKLKFPLVYGVVTGFKGEVGVIDSTKDASQGRFKLRNNDGAENRKGNISLTYGFIGNLMAFEVFKVLTGNVSALVNKSMIVDLLSYQFSVK
jgi:adenylyltransferase/sulfurtransferase